MELKEYILIFKKHYKLFWLIVALTMFAGIAFQFLRPINYKANLTLNITRVGSQETSDYKYDDFYRLQADERFADTIVRWLGSPRILEDIKNNSGVNGWQAKIKAQRLSSQMIQAVYYVDGPKIGKQLSDSILKVLNQETEKLDEDQNEKTWFRVIGSEPVVILNQFRTGYVLLISLMLGFFLGFWGVMLKHYWK
jgi:capsular polysaccharide biosynthesis protein